MIWQSIMSGPYKNIGALRENLILSTPKQGSNMTDHCLLYHGLAPVAICIMPLVSTEDSLMIAQSILNRLANPQVAAPGTPPFWFRI